MRSVPRRLLLFFFFFPLRCFRRFLSFFFRVFLFLFKPFLPAFQYHHFYSLSTLSLLCFLVAYYSFNDRFFFLITYSVAFIFKLLPFIFSPFPFFNTPAFLLTIYLMTLSFSFCSNRLFFHKIPHHPLHSCWSRWILIASKTCLRHQKLDHHHLTSMERNYWRMCACAYLDIQKESYRSQDASGCNNSVELDLRHAQVCL